MNDNIKVNLFAEITNIEEVQKLIDNLQEQLKNMKVEIKIKEDDGTPKNDVKLKTRDEMYKIYDSSEINKKLCNSLIKEILDEFEYVCKQGIYDHKKYLDYYVSDKDLEYIYNVLKELGYYRCNIRRWKDSRQTLVEVRL